jgi:hypothetical protein
MGATVTGTTATGTRLMGVGLIDGRHGAMLGCQPSKR